MIPAKPLANLPTHDVTNMPPHLGDQDLWRSDPALREGIAREGAGWAEEHLAALGKAAGAAETFEKAEQANRHPPELKAFDRYGMRINQVEFHPAYHDLMASRSRTRCRASPGTPAARARRSRHAALTYMFNQPEGGVHVPDGDDLFRRSRRCADARGRRRLDPAAAVDILRPRDIPASDKTGATMGMFMTEKQGGSDVRATRPGGAGRARDGPGRGIPADRPQVLLLGAHVRRLPDAGLYRGRPVLLPGAALDAGRRAQHLFIQRMKDKLGNRSNASTEMELQDTWGVMVGEEAAACAPSSRWSRATASTAASAPPR